MMLLQFIVLALVLLLLLKLACRVIHLIEPSSRIRKGLLRYFPLLELALWTWLAFRATWTIFGNLTPHNIALMAMLLLLLVTIFWYFFRDYFAGVVLKVENAFEKGQYMKSSQGSGKIHALGYRSITLETDEGEKIRIPYSTLSASWFSKPAGEDVSYSHMIKMQVSRNLQAELVRKELTGLLLSLPWVVTAQPPMVTVKVQDDSHFLVEIRFNVLSKEHVILVEENLKAYFKK
jgi:small-conductance mechanosensitive channel